MEKDLYNWYLTKKRDGDPVTARMIKDRAIVLSTCKDFIASKGWLDKFKIRYRLEIAKESSSAAQQTGAIPNDAKISTSDGGVIFGSIAATKSEHDDSVIIDQTMPVCKDER